MDTSKLRVQSKVALVTGGTKGIGKAIVLKFLQEGAAVVFTGSTSGDGPALEQQLTEQGHEVKFMQCDSRDEKQISGVIERVVQTYGRLDIAVNNVGNTAPTDSALGKVHETPLEAFEDTLHRNLTSTFLSMKHEIAAMLRQGGGVICNTASMAGVRVSSAGSPSYHAAKAAVIHLTRKAAIQYARDNIRVNVVAPGATVTERVLSRWTREEFDQLATVHPTGRAVTPEECADAFLFLCSDEASSITGHMVPIDGGWTAN
ncbi:SDR family NAD(P)-dependent oxidoreductase [Burkholderia sp. Bp8963]|uniref:SDR family NAD(P)-dependent oxidoreductase n=1 Tax=Burkholderia sp. Bp8963 TaxID=2184547 RepID=UPI000F596645|nr:SDR family oxidoreductase [Burkholderia sp. Bp8963]RQS67019.1 SDR family NAD(P)-dependent oxidoreductase [Burkholderia sp. Bp8963]